METFPGGVPKIAHCLHLGKTGDTAESGGRREGWLSTEALGSHRTELKP